MLADPGYTSIAVDMYGTGKVAEHPDNAMAFMEAAMKEPGQVNARFDAAMALLKAEPGVKHSFTVPDATEKGKAFYMPFEYNEQADKDSWACLIRCSYSRTLSSPVSRALSSETDQCLPCCTTVCMPVSALRSCDGSASITIKSAT